MSFYVRTESGSYVPVSFEEVKTDDWNDSFIVVRVKNEEHATTQEDIDSVYEALEESEALETLENTSFFITADDMKFSNAGKTEDIKKRLLEGEELADILEGAK